MRRLITFKIDESLQLAWDLCGYDLETQESEKERLLNILLNDYQTFVSNINITVDELRKQLQLAKDEFYHVCKAYHFPNKTLPYPKTKSIPEQISQIKNEINKMKATKEKILSRMEELDNQLENLYNFLEVPQDERAVFSRDEPGNLGPENIKNMKEIKHMLENEKANRIKVVERNRKALRDLLESTKYPKDDSFDKLLTVETMGPDLANQILEKITFLVAEQRKYEDEFNDIIPKIDNLYDLLLIDPEDQKEIPNVINYETLNEVQEELNFLQEQIPERFQAIKSSIQNEIDQYWEEMEVPSEKRNHYSGDLEDLEAQLVFLRDSARTLQKQAELHENIHQKLKDLDNKRVQVFPPRSNNKELTFSDECSLTESNLSMFGITLDDSEIVERLQDIMDFEDQIISDLEEFKEVTGHDFILHQTLYLRIIKRLRDYDEKQLSKYNFDQVLQKEELKSPSKLKSPRRNTNNNVSKSETMMSYLMDDSDNSDDIDISYTTMKSTQNIKSPMLNKSPRLAKSPRLDKSPKLDKSPRLDKSSKLDKSIVLEQSPRFGKSPKVQMVQEEDLDLNTWKVPTNQSRPTVSLEARDPFVVPTVSPPQVNNSYL